MKNPLVSALLLASMALTALPSLSEAQTLPSGVGIVPIYDTTDATLSFRKSRIPVTSMFEIPGKPKHFLVLGYYGYLYTLYPDTNAPGQVRDTLVAGMGTSGMTVHKYHRTQVADFLTWTMKGWEFGATGMTVDPNFKTNRRFYVIYNRYNTANEGGVMNTSTGFPNFRGTAIEGPGNANGRAVVDRYTMNADYNGVTRDTIITDLVRGTGYGSSNAAFGMDGMLYVTNNAYGSASWDSTIYMRKILRINVNQPEAGRMYTIPTDNPWYNVSNPSVRKEIFAFGFRNNYSMSVNYLDSGKIFSSETGQSQWEEVNRILPGRNYGWNSGGDAAQPSNDGNGIQGPCILSGQLNQTSAAGAYNGSYMTPFTRTITGTAYNGTYTCANFTNARWSFSQNGAAQNGLASASSSFLVRVSAIGPVFRGDSTSPYYGYMFLTDINGRHYAAVKEGNTPEVQPVGTGITTLGTAMTISGCGQHNGPTSWSEDSYGNLYPIYLSSSSSGHCANGLYDIYRLNHAQLTPRATPRSQVFVGNPGVVAIHAPIGNVGKMQGAMVNSAMAGVALEIPKGYSGANLYNVKGRLVWSYSGTEKSVRVPSNIEMGILQVKFVR